MIFTAVYFAWDFTAIGLRTHLQSYKFDEAKVKLESINGNVFACRLTQHAEVTNCPSETFVVCIWLQTLHFAHIWSSGDLDL